MHDTPQDTIRGQAYASPIPPLEDGPRPRYIRSEPLGPSAPFGSAYGPAYGHARGPVPLRLPRKSLLLAGVLALLFGPFGMAYSTLFGAFVMLGVVFWGSLLSAGHASGILWLGCVVWALYAAHAKNSKRRRWEEWAAGR